VVFRPGSECTDEPLLLLCRGQRQDNTKNPEVADTVDLGASLAVAADQAVLLYCCLWASAWQVPVLLLLLHQWTMLVFPVWKHWNNFDPIENIR
jgi:hypothetical protein